MLLALLCVAVFVAAQQQNVAYLPLNGTTWTVTNGTSAPIPATVPGQIHIDLLNAGIIDDPYYRFNDVNYQWIALGNWTYSSQFNLPQQFLDFDIVELVFLGLDTIAQVSINGNIMLNANNMFRTWTVNVKSVLVEGSNTISVAFTSAISYAETAYNSYPIGNLTIGIPPSCPPSQQNGFCHSNFIRKEPCSFSWDWGPAFAPSGIWREVYLVGYSQPIIIDFTVITTTLNYQNWNLTLGVHTNSSTTASYTYNVVLTDMSGNVVTSVNFTEQFQQGSNNHQLTLQADGVSSWWPNGYGTQSLYVISVTINENTKTHTIGFRTVALVQEPVGEQPGLSFYFTINNVPIFIKGANWVPADSFEQRVTNDTLFPMMDSYRISNFNTLRNWGGGIYQQDLFYELADQMGILIWEEFMFACSLYETGPDFLENVAQEVFDNVLRIQHHPSVFVWSGNNENEVSIAQNWYGFPSDNEQQYASMYSELYFGTVFAQIPALDSSRPVLSSSPSNGYETATNPIAANPQDTTYGDVHYYNYETDCWDITSFPRPRFASEYGFESYPSFETLAPVSNESLGDWNYNSAFMNHRQHHPDGNAQILQQASYHYAIPPNNTENPLKTFKDTLYITQIMQAMCIKTESEHYRRCKDVTAGGYTMGAIYWQANDIWQAPSWASIEYGGRWKMLQYFAKNFYTSVLVSLWTIPATDSFGLYVVSDLTVPLQGYIVLDFWKWNGTAQLFTNVVDFSITPLVATQVLQGSISSLLASAGCESTTSCVLKYFAYDINGNLLSHNFYFFSSLSNVTLLDPNFEILNIEPVFYNGQTNYQITFTSSAVAAFTWFETTLPGRFSDNGLLALPGQNVVFFEPASPSTSVSDLQDSLTVSSLYDVYN